LGGVCAGLSTRFGVSALIIRLVFIALTAFFGLGIILYLIFWISLDNINNRNSALAAQGKAQTAKKIASFKTPKENPLMQLQRIIFLPVSLIGTLAAVIGKHFSNRKKAYRLIAKTLFTLLMLGATFMFAIFIYGFNQSQLFESSITWLISAATIYLVMMIWLLYIRKYYSMFPKRKIDKRLVLISFVSTLVILTGIGYFIFVHSEHQSQIVIKKFKLTNNRLSIQINELNQQLRYIDRVRYHLKTSKTEDKQLIVHINYSSNGKNIENAQNNIHSIDYYYSFENNRLKLDSNLSLQDNNLNRGQSIDVVIEIPQNTVVNSPWMLAINTDEKDFTYNVITYNIKPETYLAKGAYLHEYGENFKNKLSENEISELRNKFCQAFYLGEPWTCESNILQTVSANNRFDQAFKNDQESIEQLRQYLLSDRSILISHLREINQQVIKLNSKYPVISRFMEYVKHLINIKSIQSEEIFKSSSG